MYSPPSYGVPEYVEMPMVRGASPHAMPLDVHHPPPTYNSFVDTGTYGSALPQNVPPQHIGEQHSGEVPHPEEIAEDMRKNLAQAEQNLAWKIKELTEESEKHKKSIQDQAQQQIKEYADRLQEQVSKTASQVDTQLQADIERAKGTIADYRQRLEAQAEHALSQYKQKQIKEVTEKAQQEYKAAENHAKAELEAQLKAAQTHSAPGSKDWEERAHARYLQQIQQMKQAMQTTIQKAAQEPILPAIGRSQVPLAQQAQALQQQPKAPAALALEHHPDDTN